ncbi:MAG: Gfo/Idh/MocA family oxidoreductase [Acidobacteriota bacterium]|nr:Gfo/Idh/MocA family oxidoreductase [Acidobacteriota bacterium]
MSPIPKSTADPLRIGVVGTGALGRHHVRILAELSRDDGDRTRLMGIHDARPQVAEELAQAHGTRVFPDVASLADEVDAMVVAVPTVDHGAVALPLLERGIHVLVEKPIAPSLEEADRMVAAAGEDTVLAVGHVEFYNPAVQALLDLGVTARFVEIQRLSPFTRRSLDIDVILDLMIHDLQILHALDPSPVAEVRATGIPVLSPLIDIANARVELESGCVANITASRVSAEKVRKLRVFGTNSYSSLDYQEQEIKRYRLAAGGAEPKILEDPPKVTPYEPLKAEAEAFLRACRGEEGRWVDGAAGRQALATALSLVAAIC